MARNVKEIPQPDKEQDVTLFNYQQAMQALVDNHQREVQDLEHRKLLIRTEMRQVQDNIQKEKMAFDQYKRQQNDLSNQAAAKRENDFNLREHKIQITEREYTNREINLKNNEARVADLLKEKNDLNMQRIEVEKLRNKAMETLSEATAKQQEAGNAMAQTAQKAKGIEEKLNKIDGLNKDLAVREDKLAREKDELAKASKNLEELKKFVDPKIKQISEFDKLLSDKEKNLKAREDELENKIKQNDTIIRGLENRAKELNDRERKVLTMYEEVTRKAMLAGVKLKENV